MSEVKAVCRSCFPSADCWGLQSNTAMIPVSLLSSLRSSWRHLGLKLKQHQWNMIESSRLRADTLCILYNRGGLVQLIAEYKDSEPDVYLSWSAIFGSARCPF